MSFPSAGDVHLGMPRNNSDEHLAYHRGSHGTCLPTVSEDDVLSSGLAQAFDQEIDLSGHAAAALSCTQPPNRPNDPTRVLIIRNVAHDTPEEELRSIFQVGICWEQLHVQVMLCRGCRRVMDGKMGGSGWPCLHDHGGPSNTCTHVHEASTEPYAPPLTPFSIAILQAFGDVRGMYTGAKPRGLVVVAYFDVRAAISARDTLQGTLIKTTPIDIEYSHFRDAAGDKNVNQVGRLCVCVCVCVEGGGLCSSTKWAGRGLIVCGGQGRRVDGEGDTARHRLQLRPCTHS